MNDYVKVRVTSCVSVLSHVRLFVTPWTVACQTPLSILYSRQEYWSGLPYLPPGDLPKPGIEILCPVSPALQADSLPLRYSAIKKNEINVASICSNMDGSRDFHTK